jgi:hypothetical protein
LRIQLTTARASEAQLRFTPNANQGSSFDDLLIKDLTAGGVLLWEDFNDGLFPGWTVVDDRAAAGDRPPGRLKAAHLCKVALLPLAVVGSWGSTL